jgi:hypothetical protein
MSITSIVHLSYITVKQRQTHQNRHGKQRNKKPQTTALLTNNKTKFGIQTYFHQEELTNDS